MSETQMDTVNLPVKKSRKGRRILILLLLVGVIGWLYFFKLEYLRYTHTYKEQIDFEWTIPEYFLSYDEPDTIYYVANWSGFAQTGVQTLCCTLHDYIYKEKRLYKFNLSTHDKSEFVNIFTPDYPGDPPASGGDGDYQIMSNKYQGRVIYGKNLNSIPRYYSINLINNEREKLFEDFSKTDVLKQVKVLNDGKYFACSHGKNAKGFILDKKGVVLKELSEACQSAFAVERMGKVILRGGFDNIHQIKIVDDNANVTIAPPGESLSIASLDGKYGFGLQGGYNKPGILGYGNVALNTGGKIVLDKSYMQAITNQPKFPTKKEAYFKYTKQQFGF